MKKIIYLLMSLSLVAFASCSDDDKDSPSNTDNTQTENGGSGDNSGNNGSGDSSGSNSGVTYPVFKSGTENGHDYVDLGLTSGTKWATANVGAKTPQDYGNYYAWGETTSREFYGWSTYKYGSVYYQYGSAYYQLTKYCDNSSYGKDGFTDTKTTLDLSDDAAAANWGGKWRMPTQTQQDELRNQCYWVWTENYNGSNVKGYIVYKAKSSSDKGKGFFCETSSSSYTLSDAHIFLPAAGCRDGGDINDDNAGSYGYYWSSSLNAGYPTFAPYVHLYPDHVVLLCNSRCCGQSVRAVCK